MKPVADPELGEALAALDAALGRVVELGVEPVDHRDAITVIKRVERAGRRMDSVRVGLVEEIEQRSLHAHDGHHSAKVMVRHVAKLSSVEAARRAAAARALRELPELRAEYERGDVGTCQVRKLSNLFANKRVREQLITDEKRFIHLAKCESFKDFELRVGDWERLVDEDGTADKSQANHENRDMRLVQEFDGGWLIKARCGSLQGAQIEEILAKFIEAELFADFDRAKALYGDDVSKDKLERSDAQTRLASCYEIFLRAASSDAKGTRPTVVTNIVLDHAMFERELAKLFGQQVEPVDPWDLDFRSRTLNIRGVSRSCDRLDRSHRGCVVGPFQTGGGQRRRRDRQHESRRQVLHRKRTTGRATRIR